MRRGEPGIQRRLRGDDRRPATARSDHPEGLQEARDILTSSWAQPGPPAVECLAEAGGRLFAKEFFIEAYVGNVADRTNPDISPLYGDLSGLPPALLVVGTLDILLEDNLATAARLSSAGGEGLRPSPAAACRSAVDTAILRVYALSICPGQPQRGTGQDHRRRRRSRSGWWLCRPGICTAAYPRSPGRMT
jgi:hypothetical protein